MSLIVKNKNRNSFRSSDIGLSPNEYTCIGSYEDKPKSCIYYFLYSNNNMGVAGKYDCIVEYNQLEDKTYVVYQDGKISSGGFSDGILNFSKSHLITGVNKVEDTLYWTDNLNRPRKINVEKAKRNEEYIKFGSTFQGIVEYGNITTPTLDTAWVYESNGAVTTRNIILTGVTNNHPFKKNDHLYLQQFGIITPGSEGKAYNGYAKATGIIKPFNTSNVNEVTVESGSTTLTATGVQDGTELINPTFTQDFSPGDYICLAPNVLGSIPIIYQINYINNDSSLELSFPWHSDNMTLSSFQFNLNQTNDELNTSHGIITNTPFISNASTSPGGKILHAQPDDAYSPLITYGEIEDKIKYLDALSHQPRFKPDFNFEKQPTKVNHLIGKFFQFRYRYIYKDGSVSAYSNISDVANQDAYTKRYVDGEDNTTINNALANIIHIKYFDDISFIDKIEIIARDGNDGEFFLADVVNNDFIKYLKKRKNEELFMSSDLFFGGSSQNNVKHSSVMFENDGTYPFVARPDVDKLQDSLPKLAKAQTILPKNRIAYGNVVDGYDNTDIYCNLQIEPKGNLDKETQDIHKIILAGTNYTNAPTFTVVEAGGPSTSTVFRIDYTLQYLDVDTGGGSGYVEIRYEWTKMLFQNHGTGTHLASWVPRGGRFIHESSIFNPNDVDDLGTHIQDQINENNYTLDNSANWHATNPVMQDPDYQTRPSEASASYSSTTKKLSITFTYADDYNPFEDFDAELVQLLSPDTNYSQAGQGNAANLDFAGKGYNSGGVSPDGDNIYHSQISAFRSTYRGVPAYGQSYKAGANHSFGLVYYDETNRCSFVNTSKAVNSFNTGTNVFAPFYNVINAPQSTFNGLDWKIYHRPPKWATHYQWVYSGNSTIDDFIQIPIINSYRGSGSGNNKIYLGLGSLKGLSETDVNVDSYLDSTSAIIDYDFVKGDRVRFISFGGGIAGEESSRKYFKEVVDVPISSEGLFDQTEINALTDVPVGNDAGSNIPGYYIIIDSPTAAGNNIDFSVANSGTIHGQAQIDHEDVDHVNAEDGDYHNGYHKLIVEIYRPKKSIQVEGEESGIFYEVGEKMEIQNPGEDSRTHDGQSDNFFFDEESGIEVTAIDGLNGPEDENGNPTTNYAEGTLISGDVYTRKRVMPYWHLDNDDANQHTSKFACESYYLTDFFKSNNWNKGRPNIKNPYAEERRLFASVYYSDVYNSTTNYNGLSTFDMANAPYYDYNQDFGSIQSLMIKGDDLIIFHENKVGRVLVGKNIINYADGQSNIALSKDILNDYAQVYSGENGCSLNPESIVKNQDRFYFVDIKRGSILRLSRDGITKISDYGLSDYIRDLGEIYIMTNPEESTDGEFKIVAGYDPKYDEYIVTFPSMLKYSNSDESGLWGSQTSDWNVSAPLIGNLRPELAQTSKTISFNEVIKKWTSFYSYIPEFYGRINDQFVTYKSGKLYKQNSPDKENFNTFYGVRHNSDVEFPFNLEPSSVKTYNAISLESDTKLLTSMSTNMGQYNNSQDSVISTDIGYRKIDGVVSTQNGSPYCLYGSSDCNFYKDLTPGDLIRIYNNESESPQYNIVKSILTTKKVKLDMPYISQSRDNRVEVIDYKTKEGVQYSEIPFAPSKTDVDQYGEFQVNYDGDASNIFGLGVFVAKVNRDQGVLEIERQFEGNLPFLGDKSVQVSNIIPGAMYGILTVKRDFNYSDIFDVNYSSLSSQDILLNKGNFNNASDWTVLSSGAVIQKNKNNKGNVLMFKEQAAKSELKTTAGLNFRTGDKYEVSFYIDIEDKTGNDAIVSFRLGGGTNQSSGLTRVRVKSHEVSKTHSVEVTAGNKDFDPHLYIESSINSPEFSVRNLKVKKITSPSGVYVAKNRTSSRSSSLVYPCEYALYCLDTKSGETNQAGWVYNITSSEVYFDTSEYNQDLSRQKFYFIVKEGLIDGEKLKGHYLKAKLKSHLYQSKYKFNLYAANVDVDKSELSNPK